MLKKNGRRKEKIERENPKVNFVEKCGGERSLAAAPPKTKAP